MTLVPAGMGEPEPHYARRSEKIADGLVHVVGLAAAGAGGLTLLGLSLWGGRLALAAAVGVYAACLIAMLACSTIYNMAGPARRPLLRRLDHAAIFLMIAGSYTPFTTQRLSGAWGLWMTVAVWTLAAAGAIGKLCLPGLGRGLWVALYLGLGWLAVVAVKPFLATVSGAALLLLVAGGVIYSLGVLIYLRRSLPFRRAIWHGFVVAAAMTHFAAILTGVVLAQHRLSA